MGYSWTLIGTMGTRIMCTYGTMDTHEHLDYVSIYIHVHKINSDKTAFGLAKPLQQP